MVCTTALWAGIPVDVVSLFMTLIQTLIAVMDFVNIGEGFSLANILTVVSGTHGVVRKWWEVHTVTSAE